MKLVECQEKELIIIYITTICRNIKKLGEKLVELNGDNLSQYKKAKKKVPEIEWRQFVAI
ncbi:MAG: hypothetical protein ACRC4S_02825 [Cetobacterium sp.]